MQSFCSQAVAMAPPPPPHLLCPESPAAPLPSSPQLKQPCPSIPLSQEDLKRIAGYKAVEQVESGMVLGLGTGSTAHHALERIGELLRTGQLRDIIGIPTSKKTEAHARSLGIPLTHLGAHPVIDLSIDGADEVDPWLNLVKGRGGSLLREKMIEGASRKFVVIVDETKLVERIGGSRGAVPVEIVPFGWEYTLGQIKRVFDRCGGCDARLRTAVGVGPGGEEATVPFQTDNANYIVDLYFDEGIKADLDAVSDDLLKITGVVEHGMFLGLATSVIVAGKDGITVKDKE